MALPRFYTFVLIQLCVSIGYGASELQVTDLGSARHDTTGITVAAGTLELPAEGFWSVPNPFGLEGGITQLFLKPPQAWIERQQGRRFMQIRLEQKLRQGRNPLSSIHRVLLDYAREHDSVGPAALQDLPDQNDYAVEHFEESPYAAELDINGPAYALLPNVPFDLEGEAKTVVWDAEPRPLAVELSPYVNDGKHWVLYINGVTRRVDIDAERMSEHDLQITPLQETQSLEVQMSEIVVYEVYGLQKPGQVGPVHFQVKNSQTQRLLDCVWVPTGASVEPQVVNDWANLREAAWRNLIMEYDAPVLKQWTVIQQKLYGTPGPVNEFNQGRRNRGRQISMFGVLGGQAALQETFQLQALQITEDGETRATVPIEEIEGVQVRSHPFKEMLGGKPGGRLPLAEVAPEDCLFVHFSKSKAALPFLTQGSDFLSHLGSMALGRSLDYDLVDRYLDRMGLTRDMVTQLLQSNMIQEFGLFVPDLFFIDGTEVTVVARSPQMQGLVSLLRVMGLGQLTQDRVMEIPTMTGDKAYWSVDQDLVFISTHRSLLDKTLALHRNHSVDSLGQSDEFKYMLTQLAPTAETRCYVYFSDPFIRHLVSPATKIAQLRRLQARVDMNLATSAALMYRLDHQPGTPTVARLMELGYLPRDFPQDEIRLDLAQMAVSRTYGPNRQTQSLTDRPVTEATKQEAEAYKQYVDAYRRYWRQYFDPVAIRLDDTPDGGLELTTFILPLLESRLYQQIRSFVPGRQGPPLLVPQIEPAPIAMMSLNLTDKVWVDMISPFVRSMLITNTSFTDHLGPAIHVAIQDADPVLAFGGGDLLGIAGQMNRIGNGMMAIPLIVSVLTRPCAILIDTEDPDGLRQFLEQDGLTTMFSRFDNEIQADAYRVTGRDAWVLNVDLMGMAKVRFGIEVQDNYLIIINQPWSQQLTIQGKTLSPLRDLSLHLEPAAAQQQLAAMFTSAADKQRQSALQGCAMLVPLIWTGSPDVTEAVSRHQTLFGFTPRHPAPGAWTLDEHGHLASTDYGSPGHPQQPAYQDGFKDFGLLQGISPVDVSLQIEDTGLRTRIYWKYTAPPQLQ